MADQALRTRGEVAFMVSARPHTADDRETPSRRQIVPQAVHHLLANHVLVDGYPFVLDLAASTGSWLVDARTGGRYLDMFTFFASAPLGINPSAITGDADLMAAL